MDAKRKMNFINSVGSSATCTSCGEAIQAEDVFCPECGAKVVAHVVAQQAVQKTNPAQQPIQAPIPTPVIVYKEEPPAVFASGLPTWNIEPPAVVVRRKARR